jgi:hypothetical protein
MSYGDVRFDFTVPQFPHHSSVRHYLQHYAEVKGVLGLTRFNTKVESIRYDARDGLWKLIAVNVSSGDVLEWSFDKVCVCTGQTHEARFPVGLKEVLADYVKEGGELLHSSHCKEFRRFRGKRVVVVGDGVTAHDYCAELQSCGADVHRSTTIRAAATPTCAKVSCAEGTTEAMVAKSSRCGVDWMRRTWSRAVVQSSHSRLGDEATVARKAAVDVATRLVRASRQLSQNRSEVPYSDHASRNWMPHRSASSPSASRVGFPIGSEGMGILCEDDSSRRPPLADVMAEARVLSAAGTFSGASAEQGVFLDNVDAVICATGYTSRYPFLHATVRCAVEEADNYLWLASDSNVAALERSERCPAASVADDVSCRLATATAPRRGLFLGTLYDLQPSLAFVGAQRGLLPPFLMFEAQARYIAYTFTSRIALPSTEAKLAQLEEELVQCNPLLTELYNPEGLGLHSAVYFNVLQHALGVSSRDTYSAKLRERQWWIASTGLLRLFHKARSMAPLKRKTQHKLFSNAI